MDGEYRKKMRNSLPLLVETVINFDQLLGRAIENGLINRTTVAHWKELDFCEDEKKERFFLQLTFGESGTIDKLFDSLLKSDNRQIVAYLRADGDDDEEEEEEEEAASAQSQIATFNEGLVCDFEEISEVVVKPAPERYAGNSFEPDNFYRMESKPRGLALLLVNQIFDDPTKNRIAASKDLDLMHQLLTALHFQVFSYEDKTRREIEEIVEEFIQQPKLDDVDSCVVAISSRGGDGGFCGTDGAVYAVETLRIQFNDVNCRALKGKPKFFIIQACRGVLRVYDESLYDSNISDVFVEYSCQPGYLFRNDVYGSRLFFIVVRIFMQNAWRDDLAELIRKVHAEIAQLKPTEQGEKQAEQSFVTGLWKRFYFNPGL